MSGARFETIVINLEDPKRDDVTSHMSLVQDLAFTELKLNPGALLQRGQYLFHKKDSSIPLFNISLESDVICAGMINPEVVDDHSVEVLELFLQNNCVGRVYDIGYHCIRKINPNTGVKTPIVFELKHRLAVRKNAYGQIVADVIKNDVFGKGGFREVSCVSGSLKYRYEPNQQLKFEPDHEQRVVNIGTVNQYELSEKRKELDFEIGVMSICPHMAVRDLWLDQVRRGEYVSVISMRKFKGHDLIKWLKEDMVEEYLADPLHTDEEKRSYALANSKTKLPAWGLDDRFELSLGLLRALLTQIHARGLVHRDIKPQNIKVDKDANGFNVNIFDLNLSRLSSKPDGKACGTPTFVAPDYDINGVAELDEKSDVFSMALVLAMIWRDSVQREICDSANSIVPIYERALKNWVIEFNIGAGIKGLSDKVKQDLTRLLLDMTRKEKRHRLELAAAITTLEDIYLSHKLTKIPSDYHQGIRDAVSVARVGRAKLQELSRMQVNPYNVKSLGEELKSQIKLLPQNCYATREFVAALGVTSFNRYTTESMLIENVDEIVTKFIGAHETIEKQRQLLRDLFMIVGAEKTIPADKAERLRLVSGQIAHLGTCLEKVRQAPLTLDNVAAETSRLLKKAANIQRALDGFDELKPARALLAGLGK